MTAIPYALLTLGALFGFAVAWALKNIWTHTIGYLFGWIATRGIKVPFDGTIRPFSVLGKINDSIHHRLSEIAALAERAMVELFAQTIRSFLSFARELALLAEAIEKQFVAIVAGVLPSAIRNAIKAVWNVLKKLPQLVKRIEHLTGYLLGVVKRAVMRAVGLAWKELSKLGKLVGHGFARAWKLLAGFLLRLQHIERWLFGKGGLRLAHKLLAVLGLGWAISGNIIKLGKAIVSWSHHLLTAVLRYFGRLEEPLSLVALTKDAQGVLREVDHVMTWYINEYRVTREAPGAPDVGTPT